ncbi:hypothetical protein K493DRAFT_317699 [Basidiobolus meristosporus CBS 931.73]|uniref:Uncharacterized protein n=1 Tax=Basidiobolus meristosporus CBS 931.73 TaxID=1314790 RepID=A0A1Y1XYM7_9FUNG|nr:hypothetical protein K493DRAFT_317699 [Basidiobolus meristosporus CBS 931.73]|eukprot:ORX90839.1 hypothetical protein K493DRAFT_317699 [Basidiobolus meristosporus CBS 931.73]
MSDLSNSPVFANGGASSKRLTVEFSTHLPEKPINIPSTTAANSGLGKSLQGIRHINMEPLPPANRPVPKKPGMTLKFSEDVNTEAHEYHPPKTPYPYQSYFPIEEEGDDSDLDNEKDSEEEEEEEEEDDKRRTSEEDDLFPVDN